MSFLYTGVDAMTRQANECMNLLKWTEYSYHRERWFPLLISAALFLLLGWPHVLFCLGQSRLHLLSQHNYQQHPFYSYTWKMHCNVTWVMANMFVNTNLRYIWQQNIWNQDLVILTCLRVHTVSKWPGWTPSLPTPRSGLRCYTQFHFNLESW